MTKPFAKLFTFDDIGQVLVVIDQTEDAGTGPEIRISFKPKNLGVCAVKLGFGDSDVDEAWDKGESAFDMIGETFAYNAAKKVIDEMSGIFKEEEA